VWQVFRGRIRDVVLSSQGTCAVTCGDRAEDVQDVNFAAPENSNPGNSINQEFQRLIVDAVPDATFGVSDSFTKLMEPLTWEFERASALDEMARSVGALWYPLANGDYVIRRFPWTVQSPVSVVFSDTGPNATVNAWSARRSRDQIYNFVTVTGERLNGDAPVYATAFDDTAGSPTHIHEGFGVRSRVERLQTPSTQGGAQTTADALLRTYISPIEEWTLNVIPDAALELGDTSRVTIFHDDIQVVTGFTLPMGLNGDMSISTRSLVIGGAV
jgi:hypothetical protein